MMSRPISNDPKVAVAFWKVGAIAWMLLTAFGVLDAIHAQNAIDTAAGRAARLTYSVSIDGDVAIVGAQWEDGFRGTAYVLRREATRWAVEQELSRKDLGPYDHFGSTTSISDGYILVGAPWHDTLRGAVFVFERSGTQWTLVQKLTASDAAPNARFGSSMALDDGVLSVGADNTTSSAGRAGMLYRFSRSGDRWSQREKITGRSLDSAATSPDASSLRNNVINALLSSGLDGTGELPPLLSTTSPPPVDTVLVSNSTLEDRVEIRWPSVGLDAIVYKVLRDGALLSIVASDDSLYNDTTGEVNTTYSYCVVVKDMTGQESTPACAYGRRIIYAPTSVNATDGQFTDRVAISWVDISKIEDGYRIYRDGAPIDSTGPNTEWFADTTATPGTTYDYEVRAFVGGQQSVAASDSGWRGVLLPPLDVSASDGQYLDRVVITWKDQTSNEAGFNIYRDDILIHTTGVNDSTHATFTDSTVTFGQTYDYCVETEDSTANVSVRVCDEGCTGLTPPGNVSASDSTYDDRITVTWDDLSSYETGYEISRALAPDTTVLDTTYAGAEIYHDYTADWDTTYTYFVRAVNNSGGVSTAVSDEGFRSIVLAPVDVAATDGTFEDHVGITWESHSTTAVLFKIYRDSTFIKSLSVGNTTYSDYGGTAGQAYDYSVVAATAQEAEAASVPDPGSRALAAPSSVSASDEEYEDRIVVSWVDNSQLEHGYAVSRSDTSGTEQAMTFTTGPNWTAYTDYNATPGVTYNYSVTAFDSVNGTVGYSAAAADLGLRVLLAPSKVQAGDAEYEEQVEIIWQDNSNAEDGYRVYRDNVFIGETPDNYTTYIDTFPELGKTHVYSVAAYDSVLPANMGESEWGSDTGSTTILAPVSFNASDVYEDRIELTWVDASNVETAYEIWRDDGPPSQMVFRKQVNANMTAYTDYSTQPGVLYRYCIKATGDNSLVSEEVCDDGLRPQTPGITSIPLPGKLKASDIAAGDLYGVAVAIDGDVAIIGAHRDDDKGANSGSAYVFERGADGNWSQKDKLVPSDGAAWDGVGLPVAVKGNVAIVGSRWDDDQGTNSGSAYVFERASDGSWAEADKLTAGDDGAAEDQFSLAIAIGDNLAIIGAALDDDNGNDSGSAYVFERGTDGGWTEEGKLKPGDGAAGDYFGYSIALAGDIMIVGAPYDDDNGNDSGSAYVFERGTGGGWTEKYKLSPTDGATLDRFGDHVALDQDVIIVGAWGDNNEQGCAYVFQRQVDNTWVERQKLTASDGAAGDHFGERVAASNNVAIIGAKDNGEMGSNAGAAYMFEPGPDGLWTEKQKLTAADASPGTRFGHWIDIGVDAVVIGNLDEYGTGSAYLLETPSPPRVLSASDGSYDSKVRLTWDDISSIEDGYQVYRDGVPLESVPADVEVFEDYDAQPGRTHEYSVAALKSGTPLEQLRRVSDFGWRPPNGNITGRVSALGGGASEGIFVTLDPLPTKALLLDGTGGYVRVADTERDFSFGIQDDYTVEAWFKYVGNGGSGTGDGALIAKVTPYGSGPKQYPFWLSNRRGSGDPGRLTFAMSDGTKTVGVSSLSTDLNDNAWHHVACVHDSAQSEIRIFIDGQLEGITPYTGLGDITNPDSLTLGAGATADSWFGGQLDEVRIWNVARDSTDIGELMYEQLTGEEVGLVAYWPLDEGSTGVITDPYFFGHYGVFGGAVYWTDDSAPLNIWAQTGPGGNYVLPDLHYGNETTFKVRPFERKRQFDPPFTMITLSVDHPVENQVNFSDISAYTLSGVVTYNGTECPASDVRIVVDGQMKGTTDKNGKFAVSVDNGEHTIKPLYEGHSFLPDSLTFPVEDDIDGIDFADMTTRMLSGTVGGGCGRRIGDVAITIRSENNCLTEVVTSDSAYSIDLPPQKYLVSAAVVESTITAGLIKSDVIRFFQNLGEREAQLDSMDVVMDMTYRAPLTVAIQGFEAYETACQLTFEGRPLPDNLPVVPQLEILYLVIEVNENYGSEGLCPLDTGTVVLYDEIFDKQGTPIEVPVSNGEAKYTTFASTPSLVAGRVDSEGNNRSFQKAIRAMAVVEGRTPVTGEQWVLVTGHVAEQGADFITEVHAELNVPMFILRDPPGDRSYSFVEESYAVRALQNKPMWEQYETQGQGGIRLTVESGAKFSWFLGLGAGTLDSIGMQNVTETELMFGALTTYVDKTELTVTAKTRLSTSPDQMFIGEDADVFVGAGINYIFAKTGRVEVADCEVVRSTGIGFQPEGISTIYAYTRRYITDALIPELRAMADNYAAQQNDSAAVFEAMIVDWQSIVADNDTLKMEADTPIKDTPDNRSFSGGTEISYMLDHVETHTETWKRSFVMDTKSDILGFKWGSSKTGKYRLQLPIEVHHEEVTEYRDTTTIDQSSMGYVLSDHNPGDHFTLNIKGDGTYPSPVFDVLAGASSCPYEAWPDLETREPRVMSRDKAMLFIDPPQGRHGVPADEEAVFTLNLVNMSPTEEPRRYVLREVATANPYGAQIRANGVFINDDLVYYPDPGQSQELTVTVQRGPTHYKYERLGLMVYPLCEWWVYEDGGSLNLADTVYFDVTFEAPCSDITLFRPESGWVVDQLHPSVELNLTDYDLQIGEDKTLQSVWGQHRRLTAGGGATAWDSIPADSLGQVETLILWTPPASLPDGIYELRAMTVCTGGPGYSGVVTGTIDRHGPVVFGTPEPADEDLSFGEDISITFNEAIACAAIHPDSITLTWLDGPDTGSLVGIETTCSGKTIIIKPMASENLLEGRLLEARVSGVRDGVGNEMPDAVTWTFYYRKNRFAWTDGNPSKSVPFRNPGAVTAELANGTGAPIDFTITQRPDWITAVTPETGTIPSGATELITFAILDTTIGTYADSVVAEGVAGAETSRAGMYLTLDVSCFPADWQMTPGSYEHTMTMVAELDVGGTISTDTNDRVAAFVGNQLRGVANVQSVAGLPSTHLTFLTIYGNRTQGETVRFQVWDDSDCKLYNATLESYPFVANDQIGAPQAPVTLTATTADAGGDSVLAISVNAGWTWFSTNIFSPDMSAAGVTSDLTPSSGDILKSQTAFTQFVDETTGWTPALVLDNVSGYMIRLSQAGTIFHTGTPVPVDSVIPVSQGWNWIGYLPQGPIEVGQALNDLQVQGLLTTNDVIKSQEGFAQYVAGTWYGSLDSMRAGEGYKLSIAASGDHTFNYPDYSAAALRPVAEIAKAPPDTGPSEGAPAWSVNPHAYQYNMTVTAVLRVDDSESSDPNDMIGAFVGDECRGTASPIYVYGAGRYMAFLMIYSNLADGEEVTFRAFDADADRMCDVEESVVCRADAVEGTVLEPLVLNAQPEEAATQDVPTAFGLAQNYPNPFNPSTSIGYDVPAGGGHVTLRIYDVGGRLVRTLIDGFESPGRRSVTWHGRDARGHQVATGVYFYRMTAPGFERTRKLVLLK